MASPPKEVVQWNHKRTLLDLRGNINEGNTPLGPQHSKATESAKYTVCPSFYLPSSPLGKNLKESGFAWTHRVCTREHPFQHPCRKKQMYGTDSVCLRLQVTSSQQDSYCHGETLKKPLCGKHFPELLLRGSSGGTFGFTPPLRTSLKI